MKNKNLYLSLTLFLTILFSMPTSYLSAAAELIRNNEDFNPDDLTLAIKASLIMAEKEQEEQKYLALQQGSMHNQLSNIDDNNFCDDAALPKAQVLIPAEIEEKELIKTGGPILCMALSPDGNTIAVATGINIFLYSTKTSMRTNTLIGHTKNIIKVTFLSDGQHIISGSNDKTIRVWSVATGECLKTFQAPDDARRETLMATIAFSPNGQYVGLITLKGQPDDEEAVYIWCHITDKLLTITTGNFQVDSLDFSPNGHHIALASNGHIKIWDINTNKHLKTLYNKEFSIDSITFSPNGQHIASESIAGRIDLWNTETNECSALLTKPNVYKKTCLQTFSPDSQYLVSKVSSHQIYIWNVATGECLKSLTWNDSISSVIFSPDSQSIIVGFLRTGVIKKYDISRILVAG